MNKLVTSEFAWFIAIGGAQFAIDASIFTGLLALGASLGASNIIAKATAALIGYYLNQRFTFGLSGNVAHPQRLLRLLVLWATLTILSTVLLAAWQLLSSKFIPYPFELVMAVGKIAVEILLVPVSFQIAKRWVYKAD